MEDDISAELSTRKIGKLLLLEADVPFNGTRDAITMSTVRDVTALLDDNVLMERWMCLESEEEQEQGRSWQSRISFSL